MHKLEKTLTLTSYTNLPLNLRVTNFSRQSVAMHQTLANLVISQIQSQIDHQNSDQNVDIGLALDPSSYYLHNLAMEL